MLLADVVATSAGVASTRSREGQDRGVRGAVRARSASSSAEEIETVTSYLAGSLRQRRTGLGWRSMQSLPDPAEEPSLTVLEVHEAFEQIAALSGAGSQGARAAATAELFGRATAEEQPWLRGMVTGEVRQGALDSLVQEGLAAAGGVPLAAVRRAAMMAGSTVAVSHRGADRRRGGAGGVRARGRAAGAARCSPPARPRSRRRWTRPVAAPSRSRSTPSSTASGSRCTARGDDVIVATRSLEDITGRLPEVVAVARALPASTFVLDGEVLALDDARAGRARSRRPRPARR